MSWEEWALVGVFVSTGALIVGTSLRTDLVALMAALSLGLLGIVPERDVFSGLGSSVVVTLVGLFVMVRALEETGVIRGIAARLSRIGGRGELRVMLTLTSAATGLSLVMNNVAAGALLLPISMRVGRVAGVRAARLLMPVSFGTLLGGMATYFTSANIIMSDLLLQQGMRGLRMLDFVLTGGLIATAGIAYLALIGRHLLPRSEGDADADEGDFFGLYRLGERFWEFTVTPASDLAGKTIAESGIGKSLGIVILAIRRGNRTILVPGPAAATLPGDQLVVVGREDRVRTLIDWGMELRESASPEELQADLELAELIVPPRSGAVGKTIAELGLRTRYGVSVLALWKDGRVVRTDVAKTPLAVGDALLVVNVEPRLAALARTGDYVVAASRTTAPPRPERAPAAIIVFGVVVLASLSGVLPVAETVLAGATAMVLTRCVTMDEAYRAIEWRVIVLVAGLLPLGYAMIQTGLAGRVADLLTGPAGSSDPLVVIAGAFLLTVAVTQIIGGQVSAVLVGPLALGVAAAAGVPPHPMAIAVAIGASTAFLTATAHPVNALMMGTAGYRSRDFARVGAGLTVVTLAALLAAMWLFWGIR